MRTVSVTFNGRRKKWRVRWWRDRTHPVSRFFDTQRDASDEAARVRRNFREGISPDEVHSYESHKLLLKQRNPDLSIEEVIEAGLKALKDKRGIGEKGRSTIAELVDAFVSARKKDNCRPRTLVGYRANLGTIGRLLPGPIAEITRSRIEKALHSRPLSRITRLSYVRILSALMRWVGIEPNPCAKLRFAREDSRAIQYFSRDETLTILRTARPCERGQLALVFFAGVRPETSGEFVAADIVHGRRIELRAEVSKDRRDHTLSSHRRDEHNKITTAGLPENLWVWLEAYPYKKHKWRLLQDRLERKIRKHGVRWKQDGARHAFATHYYQLYGIADTARMLTHSGYELVRRHYAGRADVHEAEAYFALHPSDLGPGANTDDRLRPRRQVDWPADDILRVKVKDRPLREVAKELGVSDVALGKRLRAIGAASLGRGHWTKRRWIAQKTDSTDGLTD